MATVTKVIPSGSTSGAPVKIAASATPGTLFHTADASKLDEVTLYLTNTDTVAHTVTIEFGDATAPDHNINIQVAAKDTTCAIPGVPLTGGLTVKVFADAANKVNMVGFVNRIG